MKKMINASLLEARMFDLVCPSGYDPKSYFLGVDDVGKAMEDLITLNSQNEWTPVNSIEEIPKEGIYWVTFQGEHATWVDFIIWDTKRRYWCDSVGWFMDSGQLQLITAYMPYFTPDPYEKGGNE